MAQPKRQRGESDKEAVERMERLLERQIEIRMEAAKRLDRLCDVERITPIALLEIKEIIALLTGTGVENFL